MQPNIISLKILKKAFLVIFLSLITLLLILPKVTHASVTCGQWKDVPGERMNVLRQMCEYGFIQGYNAQDYGYGDPLSRAAAGTIASRFVMGSDYDQGDFDANQIFNELSSIFSDAPENTSANLWMIKAMHYANDLGIMTGDNVSSRTFRPFDQINAPETFKVFYEAARTGGVLNDTAKNQTISYSGDPWYSPLMKDLESRKAISNLSLSGENFFLRRPFLFFKGFDKGLKREEAAFFIASMMEGEVIDRTKLTIVVESTLSPLADDDAVMGSRTAPVTIVEFSDYQCPYCARFYRDTLPQIIEKYVDAGLVNIVYRDFPLSNHRNAFDAANAAECVRAQGGDDTYWQYHDLLFDNQSDLNVETLKSYGNQISGISADTLSRCIDEKWYEEEVNKDFSDGQELAVKGTPAFFINGKLLAGAQPFSAFEEMIELELNQ